MQRRIELEGLSNFRDLGGYATADGARVKWRTIFRSDTLAALTDADMDAVCDLGVTTACDLRYGEERVNEPSRFLGHHQVEVLELGLDARPESTLLDSYELAEDTATLAAAYMTEGYRQYPLRYAEAYRTIFRRLSDGHQIVIHCTAGKDRAGTASAMVLLALGVPLETVFEDYLLTNQYWDRAGREPPDMDPETVQSVFAAREEYLAAALHTIDSRFGGIEAYLAGHLGLDDDARQALHDACLE